MSQARERDALRADAARYTVMKATFTRQTAWDRYDGAMWSAGIHDPKCVGLDAVIDAALREKP